jgi:quinol monooxygenase YgiN
MGITVTALIRSKPENVEELKHALEILVDGTRQEPGCINYDLHQSVSEPASFVMLEEWKDEAALKAHQGMPHYLAFGTIAGALLTKSPDVLVTKKIR